MGIRKFIIFRRPVSLSIGFLVYITSHITALSIFTVDVCTLWRPWKPNLFSCPAVLSCSNLKLHQTLDLKNIFKQEKIMLQLTFNSGSSAFEQSAPAEKIQNTQIKDKITRNENIILLWKRGFVEMICFWSFAGKRKTSGKLYGFDDIFNGNYSYSTYSPLIRWMSGMLIWIR